MDSSQTMYSGVRQDKDKTFKVFNEEEEVIEVEFVICESCQSKIKHGMALNLLYPMEDGTFVRIVKYMCTNCLAKGKPVPGYRPGQAPSDDFVKYDSEKRRYLK